MHSGIWIDSGIMQLRRTPAERMLLAAVCAIYAGEGECTLSNKDLGIVIDIHKQSVSELIKKLHDDQIIVAVVDKSKANRRTITPREDIVKPYFQYVPGYKEIPDSPKNDYEEKPYSPPATYQEFPYSTGQPYQENPNSSSGYKEIPDRGISQILTGYKENQYSLTSTYKENPDSIRSIIPQSLDFQAAQYFVRRWKQEFAGIYIENNKLVVKNTIRFSKVISALVFNRATSISTQVAESPPAVPHGAGFTVEGKLVTAVQLFDGLQMPGTTLERVEEFMAAHPGRVYNDWVECRAIVSKWLRKTKPKPPPLSITQRKLAFRDRLADYYKTNPGKYEDEVYTGFLAYWTEPSATGRTLRFEAQKYFDLALKLAYHFNHFYKPKHTFTNGHGTNQRKLAIVTDDEFNLASDEPTQNDPDDPGADLNSQEIGDLSFSDWQDVSFDLE